MFFRTLRDLAKPQIVAIFDALKRSDGLAVGDLAAALDMSYMGVKQYCIELEKRGYLDTWRRAKETGRPELTYRLTPKAQLLFPQESNDLCMEILEAVRHLHGANAAEKILYQYFLKKTDFYHKKVKGISIIEKAESLARIRENEGYCAQLDHDPVHGLRLTEFHSPFSDLIKVFPTVAKMEETMVSRVLQAPVHREMTAISGQSRITFLVAGATLPPVPPAPATVRAPAKTRATPPPSSTSSTGTEATTLLASLMSQPPSTVDSSTVDSSTVDSSTVDSSTVDSSTVDSSTVDSSTVDLTPSSEAELASMSEIPELPSPSPDTGSSASKTIHSEEEPLLFTTPLESPAPAKTAIRSTSTTRASAKPSDSEPEDFLFKL
jgi:predicted ArsR family transcriptional regulator